jgi:hypothetical protein
VNVGVGKATFFIFIWTSQKLNQRLPASSGHTDLRCSNTSV